MHMWEFYRLFENFTIMVYRSREWVLQAKQANPSLLIFIYFLFYFCCSLIYCYYLLIVLFIELFTFFIYDHLNCCRCSSKIFASLFLVQKYLSLSKWYRIDFSSGDLQWFWHLCQFVFIPVSFGVKESKCGSWGRFSTTCKAGRRFQNTLMVHLDHDENLDTVEVSGDSSRYLLVHSLQISKGNR